MLKFIFGRAATGKSYKIIKDICADVLNGRNTVLLVPEQFTFESERSLLKELGDRASTDVSVLSFTRLYDEVSRNVGGRVANNITDADKVILMNRAFKSVKDKLSLWGKYVNSPRFTQNLINTVNEFKSAAILPEDIESVSKTVESNYLRLKLADISLIFAAYNSLLGSTFLDPADDLLRLNEKLLTFRYFEGKNVYIDSFKNFTGQQYKIIERIITQADNVYVSLTTDNINDTELSLFSNVNKTAKRIREIAEKHSVKLDASLKLTENYYSSEGLANLEAYISKAAAQLPTADSITITKCESLSDEAEFAASTIRRLVREEGYRFKDFVIIARNAETYQNYINKHCKSNDVFCFVDKRKKISDLPFSVLVNCALNLSESITTDDILSFHKTFLTDLTPTEISELENYTYLWNLKGSEWLNEWTMNPEGFISEENEQKKDHSEQLSYLNEIRNKAIEPIKTFRASFNGSKQDLCKAIAMLLKNESALNSLKGQVARLEALNLKEDADDLKLGYDAIVALIDSFAKCLPDAQIDKSEFIDLWKTVLETITIGNIPQMVDEVTFGSADRIKPSRPKIAFVLGVNQGIFPANVGEFGIFAPNERQAIIDSGIEISDHGISAVLDEEYLIYTSLCCATQKLYITFSACDSSSAALEPAQIIGEITNANENLKIERYNPNNLESSVPQTINIAKRQLYRCFATDKQSYATLKEALGGEIEVEEGINSFSKEDAEISPENALKLMGNKINISATGFDTFHRCKFSYFCRYGLGLKKIQPAEFDVLQRGTLSHYVLENLVKNYLDVFSTLTRADSDKIVDELVAEYLANIEGYDKIKTPRLDFLVNIISASLKDVADHIIKEMAQCDFKPEFFELKIGNNETIPTLRVPFGEDGEMRIRGSIDRVDIFGDYVRIVDYKTGTKVFKLPDILVGLNLQMLIYLYSVVRGENEYLNSKTPAGILYMPSKRDFGDPKALSMNGLILLDEEVISAMDKNGIGEYIPQKPYKADGTLKSRVTSYGESALFRETFNYIELLLKRMGNSVLSGDFKADPTDGVDSDACKYCDFSSICCFEKAEHKCSDKNLNSAQVLELLKEANEGGI